MKTHFIRKLHLLRIRYTNPFAISLWGTWRIKNWAHHVPQDIARQHHTSVSWQRGLRPAGLEAIAPLHCRFHRFLPSFLLSSLSCLYDSTLAQEGGYV